MKRSDLESSRALWNRSVFDLESDEVLAQLLERSEMASWRALYRMADSDERLRARILQVVLNVPLPLPRFWLAALKSLGANVDLASEVPDYYEGTAI